MTITGKTPVLECTKKHIGKKIHRQIDAFKEYRDNHIPDKILTEEGEQSHDPTVHQLSKVINRSKDILDNHPLAKIPTDTKKVEIGHLVHGNDNGKIGFFFIDGVSEVDTEIPNGFTVITPLSSLGKELLDKRVNESFHYFAPGEKKKTFKVIKILPYEIGKKAIFKGDLSFLEKETVEGKRNGRKK